MTPGEPWYSDADVDLDCIPYEPWRRFHQERVRLGLSRSEVMGFTTQKIRALERGATKHMTFEMLVTMQILGADIPYILVARRAHLTEAEIVVLEAYRAAPEAVRKAALAALLTGQTPGPTMHVHGDVGATVNGPATFGNINVGGKDKR